MTPTWARSRACGALHMHLDRQILQLFTIKPVIVALTQGASILWGCGICSMVSLVFGRCAATCVIRKHVRLLSCHLLVDYRS
jgi:TRAP-type uncharacterized transport system fused permease subunit